MRLFFVVLCVFAFGHGAIGGDTVWTSLRGTAGGRGTCKWNADAAPPRIREWHFRYRSNRRYKMGLAVWASPAVAVIEGRPMAFIGGYDQTMHALDLAAKEERWSKITNGEIGAAPAVGLVDGQHVVYWGSADRSVYASFALTGERLWSRELVRPTSTMAPARISAPLLRGGVVYITCFVYDKALARNEQKAWLYALDMANGKVLWRLEVSQGPVSSPTGRRIGGRLMLFVAAQKGLLQAFDCTRGKPSRVWTFQMPHEVLGSPVIEEASERPLLFLGSKFGNLIAIDALTGEERWKRMAGNWIDNTACIGEVDGESMVFVGSHDYNVYAFRAADGSMLWRRHLGGEVYSAPAFFYLNGAPAVAVGSLDNHVYVIDARDGRVVTSYFTGRPIWDKVSKGDTLWGSPAVFQAGDQTAIVHGSFNDTVYVLPLVGPNSLKAMVQSSAGLWYGLGVTMVVFMGVVVPIVLLLPERKERR